VIFFISNHIPDCFSAQAEYGISHLLRPGHALFNSYAIYFK